MPEKSQTQISKCWYSDLEKDGMIYAKTIRSPKKSGVLKSVEIKDEKIFEQAGTWAGGLHSFDNQDSFFNEDRKAPRVF